MQPTRTVLHLVVPRSRKTTLCGIDKKGKSYAAFAKADFATAMKLTNADMRCKRCYRRLCTMVFPTLTQDRRG